MSCWPTKERGSPERYTATISPPSQLSTPTPTMKSSQTKNTFVPRASDCPSNFDYDTPPWRIDQPNGKLSQPSNGIKSNGRSDSRENRGQKHVTDDVDVTSWKIGPPLLRPTAVTGNSVASNDKPLIGNGYYSVPDSNPRSHSTMNGNGYHHSNGGTNIQPNVNIEMNGYNPKSEEREPLSEQFIHELQSYPSAQTNDPSSRQVISYSAPNGSSFRVLSPVNGNMAGPEPLRARSGTPILDAQQRANMYATQQRPQRSRPVPGSFQNGKPELSEWAFRPDNTGYATLPTSTRTDGIHHGNKHLPDERPYMTIYKGPRNASEPTRLLNENNMIPSGNQIRNLNSNANHPRQEFVVVENDYKFGKEITLTRKRFDSCNTLPNNYFNKIFEDPGINGNPYHVESYGPKTMPSKSWPFGRDDISNGGGSSGYDSPVFSPFSPISQHIDPFSPLVPNGHPISDPLGNSFFPPAPGSSGAPHSNSYDPTASNYGPTNPYSYDFDPNAPNGSHSNGGSRFPDPHTAPTLPPASPGPSASPIKGRAARGDHENSSPGAEALAKNSIQSGMLYRDPDFPANNRSLYYSKPASLEGNIVWKRPHEISSNPRFILDDRDRFDVVQGQIGDCWLVSAIAGLTLNKKLLNRICPRDQSFDKQYAGLFKFFFWRFGQWKEVVVDDRLPTIQDRLIYVHSSKPDEFWSALVEKAYAKIMGSYEALEGGVTSEGFTDFTGGIVETLSLRDNKNHWNILLKSFHKGSFMGCGIDPTPGIREQELANGLVCGHAYTITSVKQITLPGQRHPLKLVRLRNPWGSEHEWKGAWSDRSPEWHRVPPSVKTEIQLAEKADGEFWMCWDDFRANFHSVDLCHLPPDAAIDDRDRWNVMQKEGAWVPGVSSGGCCNYQDTFHMNPQYRVNLSEPDDGDKDGLCTMIVSMTQKNRRKKSSEGAKNLTIGYSILKIPPGFNGLLDRTTIGRCETVGSIPSFINSRDISHRHELPPGDYVIIPSTFKPNVEGEFLLRVYTEKAATNEELDEETTLTESLMPNLQASSPLEKRDEDEMISRYDLVAGEDGLIDAWEIRKLISIMFIKDFPGFEGFGIEAARSMIAMNDGDISGKLGRPEFRTLYHDLNSWKKCFKDHDADGSGSMDFRELRNAFGSLGFKLSNRLLVAIAKRYSNKSGGIDVQDFILCACRLKTMIKTFQANRTGSHQTAAFPIEEFMTSMMYS